MKVIMQATAGAKEFYANSPINDFLSTYEVDLLTGNVVIAALTICVVMVMAYEFTHDTFIAMFCTVMAVSVLALFSLLPLWVVLLLAIVLGGYIIIHGVR